MTLDAEAPNAATSEREMNRRRIVAWLLALAVLSAIVFGPWGPISYLAGFIKLYSLLLFSFLGGLVAWMALLVVACIQSVRKLLARRKMEALFSAGIFLGTVLAFALQMMGRTPSPDHRFGYGLIRRLELRSDIDAIQIWVESLDPSDYLTDRDVRHGGRYLTNEEQPESLRHQAHAVCLGLDAQDRLCVRLVWSEGKGGMWGLVIGHKDMITPPSEPGMYGEQRIELRPGIYLWYVEA